MARTDGPCGIDIEEVTDRPAATLAVALTTRERELLGALVQRDAADPGHGNEDRIEREPGVDAGAERLWFTRFWAAKEAVAKARGTGLGGEPKRFEVSAADATLLTARAAGEDHRVRYRALTAPSRPRGPARSTSWPGRPSTTRRAKMTTELEGPRADTQPARSPAPDTATVLADISAILRVVLEEYGLDDFEITMETSFHDDLELESIDLVTLSAQLREFYGERVNFAAFIADRGLEEIIELTVGDLVGHVVDTLAVAEVR